MKIYDISQEVFSSCVYPGDPAPKRELISSMAEGALYNLTTFSMCAHNGTHVDAPAHFIKDGKTVEQLPLSKLVGAAAVIAATGNLTADDAHAILTKTQNADPEAAKRILLKGDATVTADAAEKGVTITNNSATDPIVMLKHFAENPELDRLLAAKKA